MGLHLGDIAPDFTANTTQGVIQFHEWIGDQWAVLFSHPADFTPVCTTELGATAKRADEFAARGVKVAALSVDALDQHHAWVPDIEVTQQTSVYFPIIADPQSMVSRLYGMIHPEQSSTQTVRSVFIIDPAKKIRLTMTYPMSIGRNFDEIIRVIDALQLSDRHEIATPANWQQGDRCIVPLRISDEQARARFTEFEAVRPYLRFTAQPE